MSRTSWVSMAGRLRARCTRTVSTTVDIDRPAADVWAVLTDFDGYPEWNPQIRRADGELVPGRRVTFHLHPPVGPPMRIRPRVLIVDPARELRLRGSLPGIFSGEHWFELEPIDDGRGTHVTQGETYRGLIVPLLGRVVATSLIGFQQHNAALKRRVETVSTGRRREPP
ncbi:SRPBCC domain-containing protein [Dactylosporangium siamense]|uniref:SRPBCC domain-containing protein n=3 Tax=Dactylosporangium siamense TaxID=685454 RepID=A0A919PTA4_9ACTN|nr:hypothetical protein Dsi01nite_061090 [Dactylosporangium siamense]